MTLFVKVIQVLVTQVLVNLNIMGITPVFHRLIIVTFTQKSLCFPHSENIY